MFIGDSVLSDAWVKKIAAKDNIFLFMGGVIYYFNEGEVKQLFRKIGGEFTKAVMAFDYGSVKGLEITNKKVLKESGLRGQARAKWGIDNIYEIETWQPGIKIIETMNLFAKHKKKFPLWKRLGMTISDRMKMMSLAKIEINGA